MFYILHGEGTYWHEKIINCQICFRFLFPINGSFHISGILKQRSNACKCVMITDDCHLCHSSANIHCPPTSKNPCFRTTESWGICSTYCLMVTWYVHHLVPTLLQGGEASSHQGNDKRIPCECELQTAGNYIMWVVKSMQDCIQDCLMLFFGIYHVSNFKWQWLLAETISFCVSGHNIRTAANLWCLE